MYILYKETRRWITVDLVGCASILIALYRKIKGITQAELAEKVNISRTHKENIEAPNMVKELAFDIADAL